MSDIVQFDDRWSEFMAKLKTLSNNDYQTACEVTDINYEYFKKVINVAIEHWRNSTTTSILNGIAKISLNKIPTGDIFSDLTWQTRFILMATKNRLLSNLDVMIVVDSNHEPVTIKNERARKISNAVGQTVINKIIRVLYLYWYINNNKKLKLPKMIYRGVRAHDLYNHDTFVPAVNAIWNADGSREMRRKQVIDILIKWICDKKLHEITDAELLSFTSSLSVAKYFSNGTGFCLAVDPT